jgi:hypothetical protein
MCPEICECVKKNETVLCAYVVNKEYVGLQCTNMLLFVSYLSQIFSYVIQELCFYLSGRVITLWNTTIMKVITLVVP